MKIGIVGLPYVGKTSLFNALTHSNVETGIYLARKGANISSIKVPDERLNPLAAIFKPKKVTPASIDYADVAGEFVRGLNPRTTGDVEGGGLEASVIAELREVDALIHVVRAFADNADPHVNGSVNPNRDIETVDLELAFADLQVIDKRLERISRELRAKKAPALEHERIVLERCKASLERGVALREMDLSPEEAKVIRGYRFLTQKPMLLICNIGENQLAQAEEIGAEFAEYEKKPQTAILTLCAKLEMEISQLDAEDAQVFLAEMGLKESALKRIIQTSYRLLGLITFFTGGPNEVRAWTLHQGMTALDAAAIVHTDFARGFIRAETIPWAELVNCGSLGKAREKGALRLEGKDYVVQDGEVLTIRFSV
jgi:GTP-binding protein YchF